MNKTVLAIATALGIIASGTIAREGLALPSLTRPYEWTIEIDTQKLQNQFQYAGSALNQVVKAQLQYYSQADSSSPTLYETLWYSNSQSIGLERQHNLGIRQGDAIAITVIHKSGSAPVDEQHAAGKAVMKAVIDANINRNMVATVKVPVGSFDIIGQEIQRYHFSPITSSSVEDPSSSDINIYMESVPAGRTQGYAHMH